MSPEVHPNDSDQTHPSTPSHLHTLIQLASYTPSPLHLPPNPLLILPLPPNLLIDLFPYRPQVRRDMLHLHTRTALHIPQLLPDAHDQTVQILGRVEVRVAPKLPQRWEQRAAALKVVEEGRVLRQLVVHLGANAQACLVRPQARNVARRVAAAAQHECWQVELLHERQARAMRLDAQVEAAQAVAA